VAPHFASTIDLTNQQQRLLRGRLGVAELLLEIESVVVVLAFTVFEMIVPSVTVVLTRTCTEIETLAFALIEVADEQEIDPLPPTAGVIQVHPGADVNERKVTSAGKLSVNAGFAATAGPLFVKTIV
jgi:hypothetical protein